MKTFIICLIMASLVSSCKKSTDKECPDGKICTAMFAVMGTKVSQNGQPYILDEYYALRAGDSLKVDIQSSLNPFEDSMYRAQGFYPILSDSQMNLTNKSGKVFVFKGFRNNVLVVRQEFIVGHDCCHILKMSGPDEIQK